MGCQLLSFQTETSGKYNHFMKHMTGIDNARFTTFNDVNEFVGILVVDRYCYISEMKQLYANEAAVNCITDFSVENRKAFEEKRINFVTSRKDYPRLHMDYLMNCYGGVCYSPHLSATVITEKAPIRTLPCTETGSEISVQLECLHYGDTVTVTEKITNPRGNCFFKVLTQNGTSGYIYSGNIDF